MVIERFARQMLKSGIFDTYVAAAFFASSIFFVLNSSLFTPIEMMVGIVLATIVFKGIAYMMLSLTISFMSLDNTHDSIEFKKASDELESLVNDLTIQEAAIQSNKTNNEKND